VRVMVWRVVMTWHIVMRHGRWMVCIMLLFTVCSGNAVVFIVIHHVDVGSIPILCANNARGIGKELHVEGELLAAFCMGQQWTARSATFS
jgi:hypothetical protein